MAPPTIGERSVPRSQVTNNEVAFEVALDLLGVKPSDVKICLEENGKILTIRGERRMHTENSQLSSKFPQSYGLDSAVDIDKFTASFENGVLTAMRKIPITEKTGPSLAKGTITAAVDVVLTLLDLKEGGSTEIAGNNAGA